MKWKDWTSRSTEKKRITWRRDLSLVILIRATVILSASDEDARRISNDRKEQAVHRMRSFASLRMTGSFD